MVNPKAEGLLDAVERTWLKDGDLGLTVRRLAVEANTTTQAIYTYYGSIAALLDATYTRAERHITTAAQQATTPQAWADYAGRYPAHWWMVLNGHGPTGRVSQALLDARHHLQHQVGGITAWALVNGLIAAQHRGELYHRTRHRPPRPPPAPPRPVEATKPRAHPSVRRPAVEG